MPNFPTTAVRALCHWILPGAVLLGLVGEARAIERVFNVQAPPVVAPGQRIEVAIEAATDAGVGEVVGFIHAEISNDDGRSWQALMYEQCGEPVTVRRTGIAARLTSGDVLIRVRVAFRGGLAGDVDWTGAAIRWTSTWQEWRQPPAKYVRVKVAGR